jgi:hypothetical protein
MKVFEEEGRKGHESRRVNFIFLLRRFLFYLICEADEARTGGYRGCLDEIKEREKNRPGSLTKY